MDAFASSTNGIIKALDFRKSAFVNLNDFKHLQLPDEAVTAVSWADESKTQVLCALMNRNLKLFDGDFTRVAQVECSGRIKDVVPIGKTVLAASEDGSFVLQDPSDIEKPSTSKKVAVHVERVAQSPSKPSIVATGGKEADVQMLDVERLEKPLFAARNVKDTWLCLRSPVWNTGVTFLNDGRELVTCTGYHQLRVYDPRSGQRKPVKEVAFADHPFSCVSTCSKERSVVAGTTDGHLGLFDLRGRKGFLVHAFKGFAGSVVDVIAHEKLPAVLSCSPDRFVRIHHLETKQLLNKIYVKSRINRVLMRDELSILNPDSDSDADEDTSRDDLANPVDDGDEEFWNSLITTSERKRKNTNENKTDQVKRKKAISEDRTDLKRRSESSCEEEVTLKRQKIGRKRKAC